MGRILELPESEYQSFETADKGHGRMEISRYKISDPLGRLEPKAKWKANGLSESKKRWSAGMIFPVSEPMLNELARAVREHWGIKNQLRGPRDVRFREDQCRVRI